MSREILEARERAGTLVRLERGIGSLIQPAVGRPEFGPAGVRPVGTVRRPLGKPIALGKPEVTAMPIKPAAGVELGRPITERLPGGTFGVGPVAITTERDLGGRER